MNDKILIDVFVPQVDKNLEIWIPKHLTFKEINLLVSQTATTVTNGQFTASEQVFLCDAESGRPFALNKTPGILGLGNGLKTLLV